MHKHGHIGTRLALSCSRPFIAFVRLVRVLSCTRTSRTLRRRRKIRTHSGGDRPVCFAQWHCACRRRGYNICARSLIDRSKPTAPNPPTPHPPLPKMRSRVLILSNSNAVCTLCPSCRFQRIVLGRNVCLSAVSEPSLPFAWPAEAFVVGAEASRDARVQFNIHTHTQTAIQFLAGERQR